MKKMTRIALVLSVFTVSEHLAYSQGFVNLNFENPILPLGPSGGFVSAANAIPGWTAYLGGGEQSSVGYNIISIGGSVISLNDTNATGSSLAPLPIQGNYSVFLYGSPFGPYLAAAVGQTGQIPVSAQSLVFWAALSSPGGFQVTFNAQTVNIVVSSNTANYNTYAADITAFAGQAGELLFTAAGGGSTALLDNIRFSSSPVPEPSTLALTGLGGALLMSRRWRKAS